MNDSSEYILAMYDVRGKQDYIYKSSKVKEIIGASYIIRDCFEDYLYPAAEDYTGSGKGIFCYTKNVGKSDADTGFSPEGFRRHIEEGYVGEVIYDGGGSCFVLYKNVETYREVNKRFYRKLLEGTYSLRVLTTYIEDLDFDNYREDRKRLYSKHRVMEQEESLLHPVNTLPIVQTDYRTSLPLACMERVDGLDKPEKKVSYESKQKYVKYNRTNEEKKENREVEGNRLFEKMITEKGEESLLAVVYIDGNNMGAKVEQCLNDLKRPDGSPDRSYAACVKELRRFSEEIQKYYIDDRIKEVDKLLGPQGRRFVIYAGDEVTFICNARDAYRVAKKYLAGLAESGNERAPRTSCAGIAVFHSHAPFSEAYRIAEECCESAKNYMKDEKIEHASLLDFHYCQGAFGTSLEAIRSHEENTELSTPWFIAYPNPDKDKEQITCGIVECMKEELKKAGRSNIKDLFFSAKKSKADFDSEIERICAHQVVKNIDFTLGGQLDEAIRPGMKRKLIYDMARVYELWFEEETKGEQKDEQTEI